MVRDIQFSNLEQLLFKIGFTKVPTTGSQQIYQYPLSGTLSIVRNFGHFTGLRTTGLCSTCAFGSCTSSIGRKWVNK